MDAKNLYRNIIFILSFVVLGTIIQKPAYAYLCGEIVGGHSISGTCPTGQTCEGAGSGSFTYYICTGTATHYCGEIVSGRSVYGSCSGGQVCLAQGSGSFGYYSCVNPDEVPHAEGEYSTMAECNAACVGICRTAAGGGYYCTPSSEDYEDAEGDPSEAGAPSGFTFDIIPWVQNMYSLASGKSFGTFTGILYRIALPIAVVLGMLMVGVAGLGIMTSEGDPSKAMNAKNQLTSAIIGLLFVLLGAGILRALISTLFTGDGTITGI